MIMEVLVALTGVNLLVLLRLAYSAGQLVQRVTQLERDVGELRKEIMA